MKYTLVEDFGKPFTHEPMSEKKLKKTLLQIKAQSEEDEYGGDVYIYDENDKDITDEMFKKLKII